jgi:hypothetical protein
MIYLIASPACNGGSDAQRDLAIHGLLCRRWRFVCALVHYRLLFCNFLVQVLQAAHFRLRCMTPFTPC